MHEDEDHRSCTYRLKNHHLPLLLLPDDEYRARTTPRTSLRRSTHCWKTRGDDLLQQNTKNMADAVVDTPPLHPRQRILKLCQQIDQNDPTLTKASFRDNGEYLWTWSINSNESLSLLLGRALSKNTHLVSLDMVSSLPSTRTTPQEEAETNASSCCCCPACYNDRNRVNPRYLPWRLHPMLRSQQNSGTTATGASSTSHRSCRCSRCSQYHLVAKVFEGMRQNTSIETLLLSHNPMGKFGAKCLKTYGLINHNSISHLDLRKCQLDDDAIEVLASSLFASSSANSTATTTMRSGGDCSRCSQPPSPTKQLQQPKPTPLARKLRCLNISSNIFTCRSGIHIRRLIQLHHSSLKELNIGDNKSFGTIGCNEMLSLKQALHDINGNDSDGDANSSSRSRSAINDSCVDDGKHSALYSIFDLNLHGNSISGLAGTSRLSEALAHRGTKLVTLCLSWNQLDDDDALELSKGLSRNKSLKKLDMNGNRIGDVGANAIACALVGHPLLRILHLGSNRIGSDGVLSFVAKLSHTNISPTISAVTYCNGRCEVQQNLQRQSFIILKLRNNLVDRSGACEIIQKLSQMNDSRIGMLELTKNGDVQLSQQKEISFYIFLNLLGRRFLHDYGIDQEKAQDNTFPVALWPKVLSKAGTDVALLYYLLRHKPDFFSNRN